MANQTALAVDLGSTGDLLTGAEANSSGARQGRKVSGNLADLRWCERSRKGCHHRQADRIVEQGPQAPLENEGILSREARDGSVGSTTGIG